MTKIYEHRISPADPCTVQVREKIARRSVYRGADWRIYHEAYSPQDALRILSMLDPENVKTQVFP